MSYHTNTSPTSYTTTLRLDLLVVRPEKVVASRCDKISRSQNYGLNLAVALAILFAEHQESAVLDSRAKCNRALREPDLHVFAKVFEDCLKRSLEAKAFSGREIGGNDDVLDFLVGHFVVV